MVGACDYSKVPSKGKGWKSLGTEVNVWAMLGIQSTGSLLILNAHFILNFKFSIAQALEVHGFTGTQGTRPDAAPDAIMETFSNQEIFTIIYSTK